MPCVPCVPPPQQFIPCSDIHWVQRRAHLDVYRESSTPQPLQPSAASLLLYVSAAVHHGHQHHVLEHSQGWRVACHY